MEFMLAGRANFLRKDTHVHSSPHFVSEGLASVGQSPTVCPCWLYQQNLVSGPGKLRPEELGLINPPTSFTASSSHYLTSNNPDEGVEKSPTKKFTTRHSHRWVSLTALWLVCEIYSFIKHYGEPALCPGWGLSLWGTEVGKTEAQASQLHGPVSNHVSKRW